MLYSLGKISIFFSYNGSFEVNLVYNFQNTSSVFKDFVKKFVKVFSRYARNELNIVQKAYSYIRAIIGLQCSTSMQHV